VFQEELRDVTTKKNKFEKVTTDMLRIAEERSVDFFSCLKHSV
jgi:hypothetical protein